MPARCSITSWIVHVLKNLFTKNFPSTKPAPCGLVWSFTCLRFKRKRTPREKAAHWGLFVSGGILFLLASVSKNETHRRLESACHQSIITRMKDVHAIGVLQWYDSKLQRWNLPLNENTKVTCRLCKNTLQSSYELQTRTPLTQICQPAQYNQMKISSVFIPLKCHLPISFFS